MVRHRTIVLLSLAALAVVCLCALTTLLAMWRLAPAAHARSAPATVRLLPLPAGEPVSVIAVVWGERGSRLALLTPDGRRGAIVANGGRSAVRDPLWSPDGRYLAYTLQRRPAPLTRGHLMVYDVAARRSRRVVFDATSRAVRGYTWLSPTVLVVSTFRHLPGLHQNGFLVRCDVADRTCRPLSDALGKPLTGVLPSASDDGGRVAFTTYGEWTSEARPYDGAVREDIRVLSSGSGAVRLVASLTAPAGEPAGLSDLRLSPDGRHVLAIQSANDVGFVPLVYPTDGGRPVRQAWDQMYGGAAWDPTGPAHLVLAGAHGVDTPPFSGTLVWWAGDARIRTGMGISGLTTGLCWSPDGDRLAYSIVPRGASWPGARGSLWVASADGRHRRLVARQATSPDWAVVTLPR